MTPPVFRHAFITGGSPTNVGHIQKRRNTPHLCGFVCKQSIRLNYGLFHGPEPASLPVLQKLYHFLLCTANNLHFSVRYYKLISMVRSLIKFGQVSENRRARFNYSIDDTIEAGVSLTGAEIKSIRYGLVTIVDGFVQRRGDNLFLAGVEIQKLPTAARYVNFDERRPRQLLLHRSQINRLIGKLQDKGATIVPLKLYFNNRGRLKVLLGVGYGKNKIDKRETIKQREWNKNKARILKG